MNSFSLVSASPAYGGKYRARRGDRGMLAYTGQNINTRILCQILHSTPYFFVSLFPIVFYRRSRMTGRFLIPFCKKPFLLSTHACPFRQLRWHFSQGKASHSLLQRRSAPRKVVRLPPDKRGQLAVYILFFFAKKSFNTTSKRNSLVPSFLSGGQNRNDDRRKNIIWLLAKNPA